MNKTPQEIVLGLLQMGFSQSKIAEQAGVTQATISRIASGKHADPRSSIKSRLEKMASQNQR